MRLERMLDEIDVVDRPVEAKRLDIHQVAESLDEVVPGTLFGCVVGDAHDGHDLAQKAIEKGAVALLVQRRLPIDVPQVLVSNVRASLAPVAAAFHEFPSRFLRMAGITGTNGKTTTAHLLSGIFRDHRWKAAMIGTLSGTFTTPPAIQLQAMLAKLRNEHHEAIAMEVSSMGLLQHRVDSIRFSVAVFTNLTQDHLDYHKTMDRYFEAKALLFDPGRAGTAVVNIDDPWGRKLLDKLAMPYVTYSLDDAEGLVMNAQGSTFTWKGEKITLPLIGSFNVSNALAAAAAAHAMRIGTSTIAASLAKATPVAGRLEVIDRGQPFNVVVDFAHTPDGLASVLKVARNIAELHQGRVIVAFGCGGDRDGDKRPQMGAIAAELADRVIVTNDNPRSEDPALIAQQIVAGMPSAGSAVVELDRASAIRRAIGDARKGDIVIIAGKGHETSQEIAGQKYPFDDRQVARTVLDEMRGAAQ